MDIKKLHIILLLLYFTQSHAQQDSIAKAEYITSFPDKISARLSLLYTGNSFFTVDKNNNELELTPSEQGYLSASLLFRSIEIGYGFSTNFSNSKKDSELFNLNFRMFYRQWMQTIDFYYQSGFDVIQNNSNPVYIPNLKTLKLGGTTSYITNKKFSFRAIGYQNEKQNKSAGSFIPKFSIYYTKFDFPDNELENRGSSLDFAISPSYYYNFVLSDKFLFSLGTSIGFGLGYSENIGSERITSGLYEFTGRMVLSYNSDTFFSGINSNIAVLEKGIGNGIRQGDAISFLEFYIGYRFKAPKKFMKWADDVNDTFGW